MSSQTNYLTALNNRTLQIRHNRSRIDMKLQPSSEHEPNPAIHHNCVQIEKMPWLHILVLGILTVEMKEKKVLNSLCFMIVE
jgi:hypothetical protein